MICRHRLKKVRLRLLESMLKRLKTKIIQAAPTIKTSRLEAVQGKQALGTYSPLVRARTKAWRIWKLVQRCICPNFW